MAKSKKKAKRQRKVVCAQEFRLEDSQGNIRCLIFADDASKGGYASITLNDCRNRARIHLSVHGDGTPHIGLLRENGSVAFGMGISPLLGTGLMIHDSNGGPILFLGVSPGGEHYYPCRCPGGPVYPTAPSIDHVPAKGAHSVDSAQKKNPHSKSQRRSKSGGAT